MSGEHDDLRQLVRLLPVLNLTWPPQQQETWWAWFRELWARANSLAERKVG